MTKKTNALQIINIPNAPVKIKFNRRGLRKLVMLPDYHPGICLDIGTVAVFDRAQHTTNLKYLGPDIGCGMLLANLLNSKTSEEQLAKLREQFYEGGSRAITGGGNHFINFYQIVSSIDSGFNEGQLLVLVHTGPGITQKSEGFSSEFEMLDYAEEMRKRGCFKREEILRKLNLGKLEILLNRAHNTIEATDTSIVYRKGAVKLMPGEVGIISSHSRGEAVLVSPKSKIAELEYSICHGTGRRVSRAEFKESGCDSEEEYRNLYEIKALIEPYVSMIAKLLPFSRHFIELNKIQRDILGRVASMNDENLIKTYDEVVFGARNFFQSTRGGGRKMVEGDNEAIAAVHYVAYCSALKTIDYVQEEALKGTRTLKVRSAEGYENRDINSIYAQAALRKAVLEEASKRKGRN